MSDTYSGSVDTMARTLWGEARGCGKDGMSHVANVIVNRASSPRWWGDDIITVCRAPWQFSCWNIDDPNYDKLLAVTTSDPEFATAVFISITATMRQLPDATDGADSYYAMSMKVPPTWAKRATKTFSDGFHTFMRVETPNQLGDPAAPAISIHAVENITALNNEYNED